MNRALAYKLKTGDLVQTNATVVVNNTYGVLLQSRWKSTLSIYIWSVLTFEGAIISIADIFLSHVKDG
jgi:hypothetical protein